MACIRIGHRFLWVVEGVVYTTLKAALEAIQTR